MKISMAIIIVLLIVSNSYSQETLETTINAYAPEGHHFQGHNKYSSLVTFNGNIYVFSMDDLRKPYINKIDENNSSNIETALIDTDENDIYRVFDNGHHRFTIGIDQLGYIHILGDMHHGNLGSGRDESTDNPLPDRFNGSIGDQMYWISDNPEDISSFSFVGFDASKAVPCNGLTYETLETDNDGVLYMTGRQSVRDPRIHTPGTMGLSLWRYNLSTSSWDELGGVPDNGYGFTGHDAVFPSIVWEPHGYGRDGVPIDEVWYQSYSHSLKFDQNNRIHLLTLVNADDTYDGSTHVLYAFSDDDGNTFNRLEGSQINSLPIRATENIINQGTILMTQGDPDEFYAEYFSLFWDKNLNPGFQYRQLSSMDGRYCYYDANIQESITDDFNINVIDRQGEHCTLNDGSIVIIGKQEICIKESFADGGIIYSLSDSDIPSGDDNYLLREINDAVLRDRNILRGLSIKDGRGVVISIDLNSIVLSTPSDLTECIDRITIVQNQLNISFVQNSFTKIELYNLTGQKVKSLFTGFPNSEMTFNLNSLNTSSQVLILNIKTPKENINRKFFIKK